MAKTAFAIEDMNPVARLQVLQFYPTSGSHYLVVTGSPKRVTLCRDETKNGFTTSPEDSGGPTCALFMGKAAVDDCFDFCLKIEQFERGVNTLAGKDQRLAGHAWIRRLLQSH